MAKAAQTTSNEILLRVYQDDGAGDGKWIVVYEGKEIRFKNRSLVAPSSTDGTMGFGAKNRALIELPTIEDLFDSGLSYTIGDHLAWKPNMTPDTTEIRYTQMPAAKVRLCAGLGRAVQELGIDPTDKTIIVDMVAGVSTNLYGRMKKASGKKPIPVENFLGGDHYFRYNGTPMRFFVRNVVVGPQAHYAALSVIRNPPEVIKKYVEEYALKYVVVDVGNFTTDIAQVVEDEDSNLVPEDYFSISIGVSEVRSRVGLFAIQKYQVPLTQQDIDICITPTKRNKQGATVSNPLYGKIPNAVAGQGYHDISEQLQTIITSVWSTIYTEISAKYGNLARYCFIVTGGGSIIFADSINKTIIDESKGITFRNHPLAVLTLSEWSVVEGMKEDGKE